MITEYGEERQKSLILDYFGRNARIRLLRRTPTFGAPVFVVDFDRGLASFPHLGLVRRRRAGDRAVEYGPALSRAARVSL